MTGPARRVQDSDHSRDRRILRTAGRRPPFSGPLAKSKGGRGASKTATEVQPAALDVVSSAAPLFGAAVGASAGGLEALSSLLRVIPGEAPLALVLVQHLARDQPSILPGLLANTTKLQVVLASDEQKIEPRHVYVIPPDARMTVSDGHLRVRPSALKREAEGTVDALFRSVAEQYKERAIGVVLSGSAHDGAAGIKEIKLAGGVTMAQEPEQATVDGMPRAAIATAPSTRPAVAESRRRALPVGAPFFSPSRPWVEVWNAPYMQRTLRSAADNGIDFTATSSLP